MLPSPMLVLEASTKTGSIAVLVDGGVAAQAEIAMGVSRDDGLFPAIQAALSQCGIAPDRLAAVACGAGPGSFTSLRIAASLAKGLAHAANVPLFAVPSLLLAAGGRSAGEYVAHSDALRGERFALRLRVDASGAVFAMSAVQRVPADDLEAFANGAPGIAVGSTVAAQPGDVVWPSASAVLHIGDWASCGPVSLESWEPEYGRLAEAQVVWERSHGHALPAV